MLRKIGLLIIFLSSYCFSEITFYISPTGSDSNPGTLEQPFATLQRAQLEIRNFKKNEPITITLRGGDYFFKEQLIFTPQDAGSEKAPITFKSYENEKPVINGGKTILNWKKKRNGVWTTTIPEVKNGDLNFIQLYVNGELRFRARTPNEGFYRVAGFPDGNLDVGYHTDCQRFEYTPGDINPNWTNIDDVEVIVYHFWTDSHLPIQSIDTDSNIVTFKHKAGKVFTDDFSNNGARYIVENVYEALDQPGEWYLNRKTGLLSYIPMPGEDIKTAEIIAPVLPEFIRFDGDPLNRQYVEFINFDGISFMYTNWQLPPGNSNDGQGSSSVPASISMRGARHCSFSNCTIKNIGTWAFEAGQGSSFNSFTKNEIGYVAAGGFRINGGDEHSHPLERTGYTTIADNHLHHFGEVYPSAVGVLLMHTNANQVAHNHIHHGYYTGVSIGWEWGYQQSVSRDNVIEYNHIHDIGQGLLSDMGAIYTLGVSPGTIIRNNLIHDINSNHYGGWGIYNDEGSTHILIENNIVYNTKFSGYNIHYAKEITVRNNIFAFSKINVLSRGRAEPHKSLFFENNICYWTQGELLSNNWDDPEYEFYFHPRNLTNRSIEHSTFEMDYNLYYNPNISADSLRFRDWTFEEWQARSKDVHSLYANPLFMDVDHFDFRLEPESPVFDLGFQQIDMSQVGPRE